MESFRPGLDIPADATALADTSSLAGADGLSGAEHLSGAGGIGSLGHADVGPSTEVDADAPVEDDADVEIDEALLDAIEQDLADIERALAMIDDGTYGRCDVCGNALDDDELSRAPASRFCRDHLPLALP